MDIGLAVALVAAVVLLPAYLYLISKFMEVGRQAGARWFESRIRRRRVNGTDVS